jgi:hypothetical protein
VQPVHFSWMWESPLRITSHASGACTNLWAKCRVPRRRCQYRFRFRLTTAPLSSLEQPPKTRTVRPKLCLLKVKNGRRVTHSTPNVVIAAAFKAAGLPVPEIPTAPPGATPRVAPGPIIAAALKAAGLVQS